MAQPTSVYHSTSIHGAAADTIDIGAKVRSRDGTHWVKLLIDKVEITIFAESPAEAAATLDVIGSTFSAAALAWAEGAREAKAA